MSFVINHKDVSKAKMDHFVNKSLAHEYVQRGHSYINLYACIHKPIQRRNTKFNIEHIINIKTTLIIGIRKS